MTGSHGLHCVATTAWADERIVAWRKGAPVNRRHFIQEADAWRRSLLEQPGRRVALYFEDALEFAVALFGAWHAGKAVCLPGDAQPATLLRLAGEVDTFAGDLPGALPSPCDLPAQQAPMGLAPLDPAEALLQVHTSGSSGEPAAILKRLDQLEAEVCALEHTFGAMLGEAGAVQVASTVSHQHIYGLLFQVLWPLSCGRAFVSRRLEHLEQLPALNDQAPCVLVSSPAHLRRLPPALDARHAHSSLVAVFSSGGPLPAAAAHDTQRLLGHSPIEVYGSSETGGIAWRQRATQGERWTPFNGVAWRVDDGLLSVRSDRLPDAAWWRTADRVRALNSDGFELLGRADRLVKLAEKRVSLDAIERTLLAGGELAEARVVLLPPELGGRLAVVAVPAASGRALIREGGRKMLAGRLRERLLACVERIALPRQWRYVAALPTDTQGKCTEAALVALFMPAMPLVQWLDRHATEAVGQLSIDASLRVLDGHFPGAPILPGIAQVDWAIHAARECFAMPSRFLRLEALKFQRPVRPPLVLELALAWSGDTGTLTFRYSSPEGAHSSGRVVFGEEHA